MNEKIDIVDVGGVMIEWIGGWLGPDAELVGVFASAESGTAKLAFRYKERGYMLTLEGADEEVQKC